MGKKKSRVDTASEAESLGHNPFGALKGGDAAGDGHVAYTPPDPNAAPKPVAPASYTMTPKQNAKPQRASAPKSALSVGGEGFAVARTRKGGWPVSIEKRRGKSVTIIAQVSGDAKALLATLKKNCATGGAAREDHIELQGDHRDAVAQFLDGFV